MEAVHEEIIPSLARSLNAAGYRPTAYINRKCAAARGDVFAGMDDLDVEVCYVPVDTCDDWNRLSRTLRKAGHDFLVMSTFQRDGVAAWALETGLSLIGVVHNVQLFRQATKAAQAFESGRARLICLAPHVAAYLQQRFLAGLIDAVGVVESVWWGERAKARIKAGDGTDRVIAIPGGVGFKTRAFEGLLDVLAAGLKIADGTRPVFSILGGGGDRATLEQRVAEKGLTDCFRFAPLGAKWGDFPMSARRASL